MPCEGPESDAKNLDNPKCFCILTVYNLEAYVPGHRIRIKRRLLRLAVPLLLVVPQDLLSHGQP